MQKLTVKEKKLLERINNYYQHTLTEDSNGIEYLKQELGITGTQTLKDFKVGFVNGSLKDILPEDDAVLKSLKKLGILDKKGSEILVNCVTVPLYDAQDNIVNLYGINIKNGDERYLRGENTGIINRQTVKRSSTLLLTKNVIDTLILYDQGFCNVMPVNGETLSHIRGKIKEVYTLFEAGTEQLQEAEIKTFAVNLPAKNVTKYFNRNTPEDFEQLLKQANPDSLEQSDTLNKRKQSFYQHEENGFTVGYAQRQYQVKGIQRGDTQLKATIKVSEDVVTKNNKPFELTTIDLYSSRSRHWFAKLCAGLFNEPAALINEDIARLLTLVEEWQPVEQNLKKTEVTKADKELALNFLKNENLFDELLADFDTLGVTGEETNKLVGYLAATSRKLAEPLSVLIQSRSAAGKSTLQNAILSLIPAEDFFNYTRLTDQALFYKAEDSLTHKILAIEEAEGIGGAAYSIRNIQTAKKITVAATGKDSNGRMKTEEYTVKGPVCVMITTTQDNVDQETASRFVFLTIDESQEMTDRIHKKQREAETLEGLITNNMRKGIVAKHHAAQRLLQPLAVVNTYSQHLTFSNHSLRSRRDHKKYLGLIRAVAFLHQYQREVKTVEVEGQAVEYIEVTLEDIELANRLAQEVLQDYELSKPSQNLLSLIHDMVKAQEQKIDEVLFTRRQIREYTGWSDWQVKTHIKQLVELEYLRAKVGAKGKEYSYILSYQGNGEQEQNSLNLTGVEKLSGLSGT